MRHKRTGKSCKVKGKSKVNHLTKGFLILLSTLTFSLTTIYAQEAIPATGGNASGSGGSSSYTTGQTAYITITAASGSVAQGVQQPFVVSVEGIEEIAGINLICSAYPNPTTEFLTVNVENNDNFSLSTLTFSLYDINGKLLETKKLEGNQTNIVMSNLVPATYFLKVTQENKEVKTFKIVKR